MNKKFLTILIISIMLLLGLFIVLKPHQRQQQPATKTIILAVKNNTLTSGPTTTAAIQGDTIQIEITADTDGELHLHGYDKHIEFKKNIPSELTVKATISGHFVYELEDTKTEIGAIEIQPK